MPALGWCLLLALALHSPLLLNIDFSEERAPSTLLPPLQLSFYQTPSVAVDDKPFQPAPQPKPALKQTPASTLIETDTPPLLKQLEPKLRPDLPEAKQPLPDTARLADKHTQAPPALASAAAPTKIVPNQASSIIEATVFDIKQASSVVSQHLIQKIREEFNYPILAKRRGWEGEVLLGFDLSGDGNINNVEVLRSSGYALLDRNASKTLSNIGTINPVTLRQLNWAGIHQLQLPIIYRLNRG